MSSTIILSSNDFEQGTIYSSLTNVTNDNRAIHTKVRISVDNYAYIKVTPTLTGTTRTPYVYIISHHSHEGGESSYSYGAASKSNEFVPTADCAEFDVLITLGSATGSYNITPSNVESVSVEYSDPFYMDSDGIIRNEAYNLRPTTPNTNKAWWRIVPGINCGLPFNLYMPLSPYSPAVDGAFTGVLSLKRVHIPESVRRIGERSFEGTSLMSVKISADCEYSEGSFPEDCEVNIR